MEYLPLGNLESQHRKDPLTSEELRKLILQVADALKYLHSLGITHRDIKPQNILVLGRKASFHVKLSDFGISKDVGTLRTNCGTPQYIPPEIRSVFLQWSREPDPVKRRQIRYDNKVDIWSFGLVLLHYTHFLPGFDHWEYNWYQCVSIAVRCLCESRPMTRFHVLVAAMLQRQANNRPSAALCFQEALSIDRKQVDVHFDQRDCICSRLLGKHSSQDDDSTISETPTEILPTEDCLPNRRKRRLSSPSQNEGRSKRKRGL